MEEGGEPEEVCTGTRACATHLAEDSLLLGLLDYMISKLITRSHLTK